MGEWLRDLIDDETAESVRLVALDRSRAEPDNLILSRLRAALLPPSASIRRLRTLLTQHPDDADLRSQLHAALLRDDPAEAVAFVLSEIRANPPRAIANIDAFLADAGDDSRVDRVLRQQTAPEAAFMHSRLTYGLGDIGGGWRLLDSSTTNPNDPAVIAHRLDLACSLSEPALIDESLAAIESVQNADLLIHASHALRNTNRAEDAVRLARRATELDSHSPEAWAELATATFTRGGDAQGAVAAARRALELDPHTDAAYDALLSLLEPNGPAADPLALREVVARMQRDHPDSLLLLVLTGEDHLNSGRTDQAIASFREAHELYPHAERPIRALIAAMQAADDLPRASMWLDAKLRERPDDPSLLRQRVQVWLLRDQGEQAAAFLQQRLEDWPSDPIARSLEEVVLRRLGRIDEAYESALARLNERPNGIEKSLKLLTLYASTSRDELAVDVLEALTAQFDALPPAFANRLIATSTLIVQARPRADHARLALINAYLTRFPESALQLYGMSMVMNARVGVSDAAFAALLDRALQQAPDAATANIEAIQTIARGLLDADRPDLAAMMLGRLLRSGSRADAELGAIAQMAQACHIAADDREGAVAVIEHLNDVGLLRVLPVDQDAVSPRAEAYYALGTLCTLLGRADDAGALLSVALREDPQHIMALNNFGYHLVEQPDADPRAAEMIERAHAGAPHDSNVLDTVAWLSYRQGRFDGEGGAIEHIEESIQTIRQSGDSLNPEVLDHYGDILWRVNRPGEAQQAWRDALALAEDAAYQREMLEGYSLFQERLWGLMIESPLDIYNAVHADRIANLKRKLEQAAAGETPDVSPTFNELKQQRQPGGGV